jgi:predicted nucleic acid-binding protein
MDVVIDTDILSTFAKIGKSRLLHKLFPKSEIFLCPAVRSEISMAVKLGILDSMPVSFSNVELTSSERPLAKEIAGRASLSMGDCECLAVAKRRNCLVLSNDRQVANEAVNLGLDRLNIPLLLRELWKAGVLPKADVSKLADEIERKDRFVKDRDLIFT